ncbi:probable pectinesterase/pectinesterase inhibitor 21 [Juglans microcarpa x Juglans regia]|uniref:probable pectinesterase/pectinesterase inhibitor 21 n=1 Tax=Juglans microcarpa x Juglans regia TaxID=2249226 RepID=UPI001B7F4AF1|nr:probable pectinesterase/pectinesterase inhibitor 21 [Juglans microcarpa x Juglans regia]
MAFGGYNDVSNHGHQKKNKKYAIIGVSSLLLVAMVAAVAVGATRNKADGSSKSDGNGEVSTSMKAVKAICQPTDYKETCEKSLSSAAGNVTDPKELIKIGFHVTVQEIHAAITNSTTLKNLAKDPRASQALENCKELLDYAVDDLQESFDKIGAFDVSKLDDYVADLKVWLSGAITYEQTCLDGFENTTGDAGDKMKEVLKTTQELTKNGLAMVTEISNVLTNLQIPGLNRRLLWDEDPSGAGFRKTYDEPHDKDPTSTNRQLLWDNGSGFDEGVADPQRKPLKSTNRQLLWDNGSGFDERHADKQRKPLKSTNRQLLWDNGSGFDERHADKQRKPWKSTNRQLLWDNGSGFDERHADKQRKPLKSTNRQLLWDNGSGFDERHADKQRKPWKSTNRQLLWDNGSGFNVHHAEDDNGSRLPAWINGHQRKLLGSTNTGDIKADVVVAKDGSGKYKTINEALVDIPKNNNKTFVIYIKAGVYQEHVMLDKHMTHVTMIGDGPTKTKITGNKNFVDGTPTFKTATVSAIGSNFVAKNIGFENSAGAAKHQAVALRVQSDMSIFFNCQMDGYQDTLYAHTHRQFYRDCTISGTIDFIFGNAAAVFQNCKMIVRKPMDNQQCIVTAQGRIDRREPTALVLQGCTFTAEPAYLPLKDKNKAFLGRPWKQYSRTIIMQSHIEGFIQPEGWLPWMGDFALNTLFYTEVENDGPGAATTNRVKWRGIKKINLDHAKKFTAGTFIGGDKWIKPVGVPYVSGLM